MNMVYTMPRVPCLTLHRVTITGFHNMYNRSLQGVAWSLAFASSIKLSTGPAK